MWIDALISAAAGVGGAYYGGRAVVKVARLGEAERRDTSKKEAFTAYYAAVMKIGDVYNVWAELLPEEKDTAFGRWRLGVQMIGHRERLFFTRFFSAIDAYWASSGTVRAVANAAELTVVDQMDEAIGALRIGQPVSEQWQAAVRAFRSVLEIFPIDKLRREAA
jgi:hypothetical protein